MGGICKLPLVTRPAALACSYEASGVAKHGNLDRGGAVRGGRFSGPISAASFLAVALFLASCANQGDSKSPPPANISRSGGDVMPKVALEAAKSATVLIGNFENGVLTGSGSGFVCDDGMIVITNKHVVTGTDDSVDDCKVVFFSGTDHSKLVTVASSSITVFDNVPRNSRDYNELDVAAIRLPEKVTEPLPIGDPATVSETSRMWSFGFPGGTDIRKGAADMPSVTVHSLTVERVVLKKDRMTAIQLAGSPTHGDSGGPVVDADGRALGIVQAQALPNSESFFAIAPPPIQDIIRRSKAGRSIATEWAKPLSGNAAPARRENPPEQSGKRNSRPKLVGTSALNVKWLTESDLSELSARELTVLRNEPFARRGYIFRRSDLRTIFNQFPWYVQRTRDMDAVQATFTKLEVRNVTFILEYQRTHGLEW